MRGVQLPINDNAKRDQIENDGSCDHSIAEPHACEAFRTAVIFSDRLQNDAPPEISVDLDVPFVPAGVDRVAPAFLFEKLKNLTEQMVAIPPFIAPKNAAAQTARGLRVRGQMFVRANDAPRCAFEMKPSEVTRKTANERLDKGETHHKQPRGHGIEFRLDVRAHHVRERDGQCAAKHQIGNDAQARKKNSEPEKKQGEREPFDAAEIGSDVGLRRGIHRLKKSFAENSVVDHRPIDKPAETGGTVDLTAPFRRPGGAKENQMFETKERLGFPITLLLFQKRVEREAAMMPH